MSFLHLNAGSLRVDERRRWGIGTRYRWYDWNLIKIKIIKYSSFGELVPASYEYRILTSHWSQNFSKTNRQKLNFFYFCRVVFENFDFKFLFKYGAGSGISSLKLLYKIFKIFNFVVVSKIFLIRFPYYFFYLFLVFFFFFHIINQGALSNIKTFFSW